MSMNTPIGQQASDAITLNDINNPNPSQNINSKDVATNANTYKSFTDSNTPETKVNITEASKAKTSMINILGNWSDLRPSKLVVSMETGIFKQELKMRYANKTFKDNFAWKEVSKRHRRSSSSSSTLKHTIWNTPLDAILGIKPIQRSGSGWIWPDEDCVTSAQVANSIRHSMLGNKITSFYSVLVRFDGYPVCCYVQCTPLSQFNNDEEINSTNKHNEFISTSNSKNKSKRQEKDEEEDDDALLSNKIIRSEFGGTDKNDTVWATLTIYHASQIGCAQQYGYGYGYGSVHEWLPNSGAKNAFRTKYESTETKYGINEANKAALVKLLKTNATGEVPLSYEKTKTKKTKRGEINTDLANRTCEDPCPESMKMFGLEI